MALDFTVERTRFIATIPLAADTVLSLADAIRTALNTSNNVRDLFADQTVANQAARLAVTGKPRGYTVYQTDTTTFYQLEVPTAPAVNASWLAVSAAANVHAYHDFIQILSNRVLSDSSLGNKTGGNAMFYMSKLRGDYTGAAPASTVLTTWGVPIAVAAARAISGSLDDIFVYSLAGTSLVLDLLFDAGV